MDCRQIQFCTRPDRIELSQLQELLESVAFWAKERSLLKYPNFPDRVHKHNSFNTNEIIFADFSDSLEDDYFPRLNE